MSFIYKLLVVMMTIMFAFCVIDSVKFSGHRSEIEASRKVRAILSLKSGASKSDKFSSNKMSKSLPHLSAKSLIGSPLEMKNQADFPTSLSIKAADSNR